jgi:hypothetical protein
LYPGHIPPNQGGGGGGLAPRFDLIYPHQPNPYGTGVGAPGPDHLRPPGFENDNGMFG